LNSIPEKTRKVYELQLSMLAFQTLFICPSCKKKNDLNSNFCSGCGEELSNKESAYIMIHKLTEDVKVIIQEYNECEKAFTNMLQNQLEELFESHNFEI